MFFVEVGTSDFDTLHPLALNGWSGLQVEPVKGLLDRVPVHENITKVNKAVSDYDGVIKFNVTDIDNTEKKLGQNWVRGISGVASTNHKGASFITHEHKQYLTEVIDVPCTTLDTLFKENGVTEIDFLKVDVEGHEINVFEKYSWFIRPRTIKVECNLVNRELLKSILQKQNYIVYEEKRDFYAIG